MCGIQDFENGGSIIWGTEMEDSENHLFPEGKRHVRARSHIFSTTLMPTGPAFRLVFTNGHCLSSQSSWVVYRRKN